MATMNQMKVFDIVQKDIRNHTKVSVSRAIKESGVYSRHVANKPDLVTNTNGWRELMEKHFPDKKLSALHQKLLNKQEAIVVSDGSQSGSHIEWTKQPHTDALKALDVAYKLKGKYPRDEDGGNKTLVVIVAGQSANRYDVTASQPELPTA